MFLYELAMELDLRSTDLAAVATRLGMGDVGPTTDLSREQLAALRAAGGRAVPEPPGAPVSPGPAHVAPTGWGLGPSRDHVGAAAPSPPPPPPTFGPGQAPPPPSGAVPPPLPPPPAAAPVPSVAPPTTWATTPSPPTFATTPAPAEPGARSWRDAPGQLVAIGVVVVLVAALFAYMAVNSGPDAEREAQLRAADRRAEAEPPATLPPTPVPSSIPMETTILPGSAQDPTYAFADVDRFCGGSRGMNAYELRISAGAIEGDWREVRRALVDGRPDWRRSVDDLSAGTAPYLGPDIERYRESYEGLVDGAQGATSAEEIQRVFQQGYSFALRRSAKKINAAIISNCNGR